MFKHVSLAIAAAAAGTLIAGMPGHAQVTYSQDSIFDGEGEVSNGVSAFELFGTGYVQDGNHLIVGISSKLALGGEVVEGNNNILGGTVAWGDMFFNFSNDNFNTALGNGDVYGVRFAEANDSSVGLGLYKVTKTKTESVNNQGFASLQAYRNAANRPTLGDVFDLTNNGAVLNNGTNYSNFNYLPKTGANRSSTQALIHEGELLGGVEVLDEAALASYGFDFASNIDRRDVPNAKSYGFKFDISKLPGGSFIAHLWAECFNEGTAFEGEITSVPEPTSALALAVVGGVAWARKRKARKA